VRSAAAIPYGSPAPNLSPNGRADPQAHTEAGALGGDDTAGLAPTGCAPPNASSAASPAGQPAGQPAGCALFCDAQSCDQCHPNDAGYRALAGAVRDAVFPARGAHAAPPHAAPVEALD